MQYILGAVVLVVAILAASFFIGPLNCNGAGNGQAASTSQSQQPAPARPAAPVEVVAPVPAAPVQPSALRLRVSGTSVNVDGVNISANAAVDRARAAHNAQREIIVEVAPDASANTAGELIRGLDTSSIRFSRASVSH